MIVRKRSFRAGICLLIGGLSQQSLATTLWSNSFDYPAVVAGGLDANEAASSSQYGGSYAGSIVLRSAKVQHEVTGSELRLLDRWESTKSGSIRFLTSDVSARFDLAAGDFGSEILSAGGFQVSFDWVPSDTTDHDWIALSAGIRETLADADTEFIQAETDMGVLLRNNGGVQVRDQLGIFDSGNFLPTSEPVRVVVHFAFDSFADGSTVTMNAWVGSRQVVFDRQQSWGANGANQGKCFITLENRNADPQVIDNLSIGTLEPLEDQDGDGLPDMWETSYGLSTSTGTGADGWSGDPDLDGIPNHAELKFGSSPVVSDDLSGKWAREVWFGVPGDLVGDLRGALFPAAHLSHLLDGTAAPLNYADNYGQRLRGWITAPQSGDYVFWISGDNECELWLSTDESKFNRHRIASVPAWTAPQEWGKFPSQQSVTIPLVAGQRYFVEVLHKEGGYEDGVAVAWQPPGSAAALMPASVLAPYFAEPGDEDMDEMEDSWEIATFGSTEAGPMDNPDGDYAPNWEEFAFGSDPLEADSNVGYWRIERWYGMEYYSVSELVGDRGFYESPTTTSGLPRPKADFGVPYAGTRVRGYVEVEASAEYHFWISGRTSADLFLSSDETPYRKQRIAYLGADTGAGNGIRSDSPNLWDVYASQMSSPVFLEAGRKYYLEIVHQNGHQPVSHVQVAWAGPDDVRRHIPFDNMSSFIGHEGDADEDSLPDDWEAEFGLDPEDNGKVDLARQGERGDFDRDGLSNREEFLLGTHPGLADSDGDGLADRDEVRTYGTDPNVSDSAPELVVETIAPSSVQEMGNGWVDFPDGALMSSFRGVGTWNVTVPEEGFWIVQFEARLMGDVLSEETIPVEVRVDGVQVDRPKMDFIHGASGSIRVISPWLGAGVHEVELFFDSYVARRTVLVTSIKLVRPAGLDLDGDGRSDALVRKLEAEDRILPTTVVSSHVSPAFVEGLARSPGQVEFRFGHEGVSSHIRHKDAFWQGTIARIQTERLAQAKQLALTPGLDRTSSGERLAVTEGPGHRMWHAWLPLESNQATGYSVHFENGAIADAGVVVWRPVNLATETEISIRAGSTLLMSAWLDETDNSRLTFTIDGEETEIRAKESLEWSFPAVGQWAVSVLHEQSGETYEMIVHVRDAVLPDDLLVVENRFNHVHLPGVAPDLGLDSDEEVGIDQVTEAVGGGSDVRLAGRIPGIHPTAARLAGGQAVLDLADVTTVGVSDGLRTGNTIVTGHGDGLFKVRETIVVTHLPPGGTVRISIFAGGVTFLDGSTTLILSAGDFDENGVIVLEMLKPEDRLAGACYTITVFDADGNVIL